MSTPQHEPGRAPRRLALISSLCLLALPLALLWVASQPAPEGSGLAALVLEVEQALPALGLAAVVNALGVGLGLGGAIVPGPRRWRLAAASAAGLNVAGWVALLGLG